MGRVVIGRIRRVIRKVRVEVVIGIGSGSDSNSWSSE
jgi:hypothetical protein